MHLLDGMANKLQGKGYGMTREQLNLVREGRKILSRGKDKR